MAKNINVVGLNVGHDGGCALLTDGVFKVAISEERVSRQKYSPGWIGSLFYCLNAADITINDIDLFVFSSAGPYLPVDYNGGLKALGVPQHKITSVDHHLSHAFSAFSLSGFEKALVVTIDGEGNDYQTESFYLSEGNKIEKIGGNGLKRNRAKGIGRTYEAFTNYIGFDDQECGKTMGLAAYGDPNRFRHIPLFKVENGVVVGALESTHEAGVIEFAKKNGLDFGLPYGKGKNPIDADIAAYLQAETEDALLKLLDYWINKIGLKKVAYAGGVALNCVTNQRIIDELGVDLFIVPASSDRGQALGNALYGYFKLTSEIPHKRLINDYFGRVYTEQEIVDALKRMPLSLVRKSVPTQRFEWSKKEDIASDVAKLLTEGKIVGWFQGGSEMGPRALGNRSIVCDPRKAEMKDILNNRVKHREPFRPFAPSAMLDRAEEIFETHGQESPFMLLAPRIRPEKKNLVGAIVHADGTGRLQTVTTESNPRYYSLISNFYKLTGVPVVLNTSFNDREPIVETPGDAVSTFLRTDIDALAIGDYLAIKIKQSTLMKKSH